MEDLTFSLIAIAGTLLLGAMNPGESFLLVARTTVATSRINGIATALSMGTGSLIFALIAIFGLQGIIKAFPDFYLFIRILGGLYLIYLAYKFSIKKKKAIVNNGSTIVERQSFLQSYFQGLIIQLSNPNTALIFVSVFSVLLGHALTLGMYFVLPSIAFMIDSLWYIFVAIVLSYPKPRNTYLNYKMWFDYLAGALMLFLGLKTLYAALIL
ncbi:LysE family translocator [Xenorhabdus szentirmaii]|uniref:Lysin transporter protein n=2 Tax=Xenorhabdus szentirmaii TaxID=290112 RepID=W1IZW4_9GAMM|nr:MULTISPECIES: LysE family translocator [Xenorhabdus]MBD2780650.1 LysE family transporter [Xenorhabdus sp. 38]MBD2791388.1 LysE family transporter [Xenorhabdus sp. CUL]MBD2800975.1 LysE family transporter [Xenorhabdus sp. M]MBD2803171.1 LysE family transporter [Xenorhabdus sp. ZM]MBD2821738.1 LysE family transporter [Xenorhabdus sp. 42]